LFGKVSTVENTFQCINLLRNGPIAMEKHKDFFLLFELQKVKHKNSTEMMPERGFRLILNNSGSKNGQ